MCQPSMGLRSCGIQALGDPFEGIRAQRMPFMTSMTLLKTPAAVTAAPAPGPFKRRFKTAPFSASLARPTVSAYTTCRAKGKKQLSQLSRRLRGEGADVVRELRRRKWMILVQNQFRKAFEGSLA